jgi:hypothetical protein
MEKREQWSVVASAWTNKRAQPASRLRLAEPSACLAFHSPDMSPPREPSVSLFSHIVGPVFDFERTQLLPRINA